MPVFSCGGMRYQFKWKDVPHSEIPQENQNNLEATIRRAFALRIHHIETARGYGTSEMQLGRLLSTMDRDRFILQTKVGPTEDPAEFLKTFHRSLDYLQLDYVDLLAIHGINNNELLQWSIREGGCLEMAKKIQAEGGARFIGFSTHAPTDLILSAIRTDAFDYINLHWYFIFQNNWAAIQEAARHDMGVFIISPSDKGGKLYDPPARLVELCEPLSPMVFNDLFCLSRPEIHTISLGAARPGDFDEHMQVLDVLDRADEVLVPIIDRLEKAATDRLGADWLRTRDQGLPSYDQTPGKINIPVILWLRDLARAYGMIEYGKMRYNLLGNGDHWFPGEKAADVDEDALAPCLAASPHAEIIPALLAETHRMLNKEDAKRLSEQ